MVVRLGVLGPLELHVGSPEATSAPIGGRRQRSLLAMLLVARGEVVSVDRLVDGLWSGSPPLRATSSLHVLVSHLRRVLEPDRAPRSPARLLQSVPPGYVLCLPADAVDGWRFEDLVAAADGAAPARAQQLLEQALGLWRGDAYAEFADEDWARADAVRLDGLRLTARERLVGVMLDAGRVAEAALEAEGLSRAHPLREESWRLLALALYASGRQADALAVLRAARRHLVDELGLDPGPALQRLEADILTHRVEGLPSTVSRPRPVAAAPVAGFIGRRDQLAALQGAADQALTWSSVRSAVVVGDPGAGKSMLLHRFGERLGAQGWTVVFGRCPEAGGFVPAWPWTQIARSLAERFDPGTAAAGLAPLLTDVAPQTAHETAFGRMVLRRSLTTFLTEVAELRPLAVLLDDLQHADETTLDLLSTVAEEIAGVPVLVVAAERSAWPGEAAAASRLLAAAAPVRVPVAGFDLDEATAIVASVAGVETDGDTMRALLERTGGNAFYLVESARLLQNEGSLVATSRVPDGVRDVLRRRVDRLGPVTVEVLRMAAVVGRDIDVEVLVRAAVSSVGGSVVDEDTVVDALEAGVVAGLLVEPVPGTVRFAHIVVRETLYDDVAGVRRSRWHARVAAAIEELRPYDIAGLADHLYRSGTAAAARAAADAATAAGDQAMDRYAPEQAVELFRHALQALDRVTGGDGATGDTAAERVELLCRCSVAQLAAGAGTSALETRSAAIQAAERLHDHRLIVRALTAWDLPTPWTIRTYGTQDAPLVGLIERCLKDRALTPDVRCRLLCALVREVAGSSQPQAREASEEAERLARLVGDPSLLGLALHSRGVVLLHDSDVVGRLPIAEELVTIGERPGLALFALIGHEFVVQWAATHAEVDTLAEHVAAIDGLVETFRWRQATVVVAMHHGLLAHVRGDLDSAHAHYDHAAELLRRNGALDALWIPMIARFSLAVTGSVAGSLVHQLESLRPLPPATVDLAAVAHADAGQLDAARAVRIAAPSIGHDFFRSLRLTCRGLAVVALGETVEAVAVYDDLVAFSGQLGGAVTGAFTLVPVDLVLGDLARLLGRPAAAEHHYSAAAMIAARCGSSWWQATIAHRMG